MKYTDIVKDLEKVADKKKAKLLAGYFKTRRPVAEVAFPLRASSFDLFLGVVVPEQRKVAKKFSDLPMSEIQKLLRSKIHEHRLTALFILVSRFEKEDEKVREKIAGFYLKNTKHINNWDLVDLSAPKILGAYLQNRSREILHKLTLSKNIWERRIAALSTFAFIKQNDFVDSLKISEKLLKDKHDLIHKAVGWMLREVGKKDQNVLRKFLDNHKTEMSRTALRYAIEKFPEKIRKNYLKK